ncbi:MAG: hypothetical protein QOE90_41 [Thermoplasmata archaeon]|jgi:hypothetical protein|nr:hypothetical protein [Thermoplasmata archaeon]
MNVTRVLVLGLLLVPALVLVTPSASAVACNSHFTGVSEVDAVEYRACATGLAAVNNACGKVTHRVCFE